MTSLSLPNGTLTTPVSTPILSLVTFTLLGMGTPQRSGGTSSLVGYTLLDPPIDMCSKSVGSEQ